MDKRQDDWLRLESVIEWANLNTNAFAREIGLTRAENLYQIKRGNNGISRKLADMIVQRYGEIELSWLLTGEGEMFSHADMRGVQLPLYEVNVETEILHYPSLEPSSFISLPATIRADVAMLYRGRAMGDVTPPNTILFLKRVEVDMIISGGEYVVATKKFALLRRVRTTSDGGCRTLRLVAIDKDLYDDVLVDWTEVKAAYRVAAKTIICD